MTSEFEDKNLINSNSLRPNRGVFSEQKKSLSMRFSEVDFQK